MLDDDGFGMGQMSWLGLTFSDDVFLLFVLGDQSLGELGLFFGEDSLLFSVFSLILNYIELLECHSSLCLGDGDLFEKGESLSVEHLNLFKEDSSFFNSFASGLGFSKVFLGESEFSLGGLEGGFGSEADGIRILRSVTHVSDGGSFLCRCGLDLSSGLC